MKISQRRSIVFLMAFFLVGFSIGCKKPWNHAGGTWQLNAEVSETYKSGEHAQALYCDGPSNRRYSVTFKIKEISKEEKGEDYDIEQVGFSGTIHYYHRPDIGEGYRCDGRSGSCSTENHMKISGTYWSHEKPTEIPYMTQLPYDPGRYSPFGFFLSIGPNWDAINETEPGPGPCVFSYPCVDNLGYSWTAMATAAFLGTYYIGEAGNRAVIWKEEDERTITVYKVRLACLDKCHPPDKPEKEECKPEETLKLCRDAKVPILNFCQTLKDWMVVEEMGGAGPTITCGDPDCTGAQQANQGSAPWVGITEHYSAACSDLTGDMACSIECYGWGQQ